MLQLIAHFNAIRQMAPRLTLRFSQQLRGVAQCCKYNSD